MIGGEEDTPRHVVKQDLVVRVTRCMDYAGRVLPER